MLLKSTGDKIGVTVSFKQKRTEMTSFKLKIPASQVSKQVGRLSRGQTNEQKKGHEPHDAIQMELSPIFFSRQAKFLS